MALPPELRWFCVLSAVLVLICAASELFCFFVLHKNAPYSWPTMPFYDDIDIRCFIARFHYFHRIEFFSRAWELRPPFGYPAPVAVLIELLWLTDHPVKMFFVASLMLMGLLLVALYRAARASGLSPGTAKLFLTFCVLFSYPLWFEFLLGNMEVFIFLLVAAAVLAFLRDRSYTAAALFAVAGSMKIVPFLYLGLLLARRQYRQLAFAAAVAVPVTLLSLWLVYPDIAVSWHGIGDGLALFRDVYLLHFHPMEMGFDHSMFAVIKQFWLSQSSPETIAPVLTGYTIVAACTGILLFFLRIRNLPPLNQVLCLTVAAILFPPLSHDYTLLNLYLPWGLLAVLSIKTAKRGGRIPGLMAIFVCFAILMAPETEIVHAGRSYAGQLKALTLVVLMALAMRFPLLAGPSVAEPAEVTERALASVS